MMSTRIRWHSASSLGIGVTCLTGFMSSIYCALVIGWQVGMSGAEGMCTTNRTYGGMYGWMMYCVAGCGVVWLGSMWCGGIGCGVVWHNVLRAVQWVDRITHVGPSKLISSELYIYLEYGYAYVCVYVYVYVCVCVCVCMYGGQVRGFGVISVYHNTA